MDNELEGERKRGICSSGIKDCLWIEERKMWHIGRWFKKVKGGNFCYYKMSNFNWTCYLNEPKGDFD